MDKKFSVDELIKTRKQRWEKDHSISKDKEFTSRLMEYASTNRYIYQEIYDDPAKMIELLFYVTDKDSNLVPFFMNDVQRKFIDGFNKCRKEFQEGKRHNLKFIILKGRQQGFTTIIAALELAYTLTRQNWQAYTLADEASNAQTIFLRKAKFMFDYLPKEVKPETKYASKNELYFNKLNSQWKVSTAGNKDAGKSMTINFFHGSEVGMWEHAEELLGGLNRAFTPSCYAFFESTAKGQNFFKEMWDRENGYVKMFFAWWDTSEYRNVFYKEAEKERFIKYISQKTMDTNDSETEDWIIQRCHWLFTDKNLDIEQVYWYYNQWRDVRGIIKQEFPCYPEEAFIASESSVFDNDRIAMYVSKLRKRYSKKPISGGQFHVVYNDFESRDRILFDQCKFIEGSHSYFRIYEEPIPGDPYVIGADPAAGGDDFYAMTVINNVTGKRVATFHAKVEPDDWVAQLLMIGRHYNNALIAPEINIDPYTVIELKRLGYHNIYRRESFDKKKNKKTEKIGWRTDVSNRQMMITNHKVELRECLDRFSDIPTLEEAMNFVVDNKGKAQAAKGKHDDLIMSDMIASAIRPQQTTKNNMYTDRDLSKMFFTKTELEDMDMLPTNGGIVSGSGEYHDEELDYSLII